MHCSPHIGPKRCRVYELGFHPAAPHTVLIAGVFLADERYLIFGIGGFWFARSSERRGLQKVGILRDNCAPALCARERIVKKSPFVLGVAANLVGP